MKRIKRFFIKPFNVILVVATVWGLVWLSFVPPFQGADESVHLGRVKLWLYSLESGFQNFEAAQASCQEDMGALLEEHRTNALRFNPLSSYAAPQDRGHFSNSSGYDHGCERLSWLSFYYWTTLPFAALNQWSGIVQFYGIRLWSLVIVLMGIKMAHETGKLLFKEESDRLLIPAFLALQPLFMITGMSVSYDGLTNMFFLIATAACVSYLLEKGPCKETRRFLKVGVVVSLLGMLTKWTGVLLPFYFGLALLLSGRFSRKTLIAFMAGTGVFAAVITMGLESYRFPIEQFFEWWQQQGVGFAVYTLFIERWIVVFESFWGGWGFGWLDVYTPPVFLIFFSILTCGGVGGALLQWFNVRKKDPILTFSLFVFIGF